MPRYRLLALDIDGTLVNSQDQLTPPTRSAILRAKQAGIEIVLATGRRYSRTLPLVEPLELNVPLVTASGAIKRAEDHRTLYQAEFGPGVLEACLDLVTRAGFEAVLYSDSYAAGFDFYCTRIASERPELRDFFAKNIACERLLPELMTRPPAGIFAGFAMGTRSEMVALEALLERELGDQLYVHVLRSPRYLGFMCEIAPYGVSKWSGIRALADGWGIRPEEICAVGDDVNDIPMITGAGLGVAMGNALDVVKAVAQRVAPGHDEDGLVQVVEWLFE